MIAIVLILIAIAIPNAHKYLMSAHELAAIRQIGAIHQAQTHYYSQFGKYAAVLADLGPPTSGADGSSGADLIPRNLAAGKNSGYIFQVAGSSAGYTVTAVPESFGGSGARTF